MEKKHKDILISQRANLVENLNIRDGLFTQLIAKKVLTQRMVRSIQNGKTIDEQIETLLDRLPCCGSKAFDLFCEALQEDFQEEIVNLYLKPENSEEPESDNKSVTAQESSNASTISEESMGDNGQVKISAGSDGEAGHVSATGVGVSSVAIREEYQQQIYRRSIEPSLVDPVASVNGKGVVDQQDARYLYQNILGNPGLVSNSVYSILTNPTLTDIEKKKLISEQSQSPSKLSGLSSICRENSYVTDSFHSKEHLLSSPLLRSFQSDMQTPSNHLDSHLQKPVAQFSFQTLPRSLSSINGSLNVPRSVQEIHSSPVKHPSVPCNETDSSIPLQVGPYHVKEVASRIPTSLPEPQFLGRDMRELERHREVMVPSDGVMQRELMSLPRHVEMVPSSEHLAPHCPTELGISQNYHNVQSLKRNDSVDTMNKRPFTENQEPNAKRFRENRENIPTNLENQSTVKFIDERSNQMVTIPVLEGMKRLPSQPSVVVEIDRHMEMNKRGSLLGVMDDPEIDLTDGPINVMVEHSTRQFYLTNYKQAYKMRSIPRGKALIMNVNEVVGKSARRGTDIDRDNLHNLLCQLHFDVTVYNDQDGLTAKEIVLKLQDFSQDPAHKLGDCAVICILSHGEEGYIFGADGKKFELDAVFSLFDNTCCENLRGKPKMFIIQACRGGALDRGVQYSPDEHDGSDARVRQVPSMSDMLICYPTQNGYYAWRNRDRGSWYVEALVQVFQKYARSEDVCTMLNRVNLLVSKKVSHCPTVEMDQMSQMSEYKSTLRMPHFFFFPGIGGT